MGKNRKKRERKKRRQKKNTAKATTNNFTFGDISAAEIRRLTAGGLSPTMPSALESTSCSMDVDDRRNIDRYQRSEVSTPYSRTPSPPVDAFPPSSPYAERSPDGSDFNIYSYLPDEGDNPIYLASSDQPDPQLNPSHVPRVCPTSPMPSSNEKGYSDEDTNSTCTMCELENNSEVYGMGKIQTTDHICAHYLTQKVRYVNIMKLKSKKQTTFTEERKAKCKRGDQLEKINLGHGIVDEELNPIILATKKEIHNESISFKSLKEYYLNSTSRESYLSFNIISKVAHRSKVTENVNYNLKMREFQKNQNQQEIIAMIKGKSIVCEAENPMAKSIASPVKNVQLNKEISLYEREQQDIEIEKHEKNPQPIKEGKHNRMKIKKNVKVKRGEVESEKGGGRISEVTKEACMNKSPTKEIKTNLDKYDTCDATLVMEKDATKFKTIQISTEENKTENTAEFRGSKFSGDSETKWDINTKKIKAELQEDQKMLEDFEKTLKMPSADGTEKSIISVNEFLSLIETIEQLRMTQYLETKSSVKQREYSEIFTDSIAKEIKLASVRKSALTDESGEEIKSTEVRDQVLEESEVATKYTLKFEKEAMFQTEVEENQINKEKAAAETEKSDTEISPEKEKLLDILRLTDEEFEQVLAKYNESKICTTRQQLNANAKYRIEIACKQMKRLHNMNRNACKQMKRLHNMNRN